MENLDVGDLVMCKAKKDIDGPAIESNAKLVIGWITKKEMGKFYVHWCDKDCDGPINEASAILTRKLFLEKRKAMGI